MRHQSGKIDKLEVFVSYSRDDLEFADQLDTSLRVTGFSPTIDRHGISGGEDWKRRLENLIRDADTIVFVLSPSSAMSEICAWEVDQAVRLGKRIIPVLCRSIAGVNPPPQLAGLNYIYFYAEPKSPGSGFGTGLQGLVTALNTDLEWLREHTRYLQRATEWSAGGRLVNRLLSGADISLAKSWAANRPKDAPAPTELHLDFIKASEVEQARRQNAEEQRLAQIADAQAAREAALTEKDAAQKREAKHARLVVQRTRIGLAVALVFALVAGAAGLYALHQKNDAELQAEAARMAERQALEAKSRAAYQAKKATEAAAHAEVQATKAAAAEKVAANERDTAHITGSLFLAGQALQKVEDSQPVAGMLLALHALPDSAIGRQRPYIAEAEQMLYAGHFARRAIAILSGHSGGAGITAFSPNSNKLATVARYGKTVRLWNAKDGAIVAVLKGHSGSIRKIAFSPQRAQIATVAADASIRIWDANTGAAISTLLGHSGSVDEVAFSPDGRRLATASTDRTVKLWDAITGTIVATINQHKNSVARIAFGPDGSLFATASENEMARLWSAETGRLIAALEGHLTDGRNIVFSPDGSRLLASGSKPESASTYGTRSHAAQLWDTKTGKAIATLEGHSTSIQHASFSPNGARLATISRGEPPLLWDAVNGSKIAVLEKHSGQVTSLAFSPDSKHLATGSVDKTVQLWAAKSGTPIAELRGHTEAVTKLVFSPDNSQLATASKDRTVQLWSPRTRKLLTTLKGHSDVVWGLYFSSDGARLATSSPDGTVRLWEPVAGFDPASTSWTSGDVSKIRFSPDGKSMATFSRRFLYYDLQLWSSETGIENPAFSGELNSIESFAIDANWTRLATNRHLWNINTGTKIAELAGHPNGVDQVVFSPDGSRFVTRHQHDKTARLWDADSGKLIAPLEGHLEGILEVAFGADSARVATTSWDGTARLWNAKTGAIVRIFEHSNTVRSLTMSPDGTRLLAILWSEPPQLWDIRTGTLITILTGHTDEIWGAEFSPDGSRIITTSKDKTSRLWNGKTGRAIATFIDNSDSYWSVTFNPDGSRLATAAGNIAQVREAKTGKLLATFEGHSGLINKIIFSPDGSKMATSSTDKTVRLWNVRNGNLIAILSGHSKTVSEVAFSPDGHLLATAPWNGMVRLWRVFPTTQALIEHVKTVVPRCLTTIERREAYLEIDSITGPPSWCITGPGIVHELTPEKWQGKWPYHTDGWRDWLLAKRRGVDLPLPPDVAKRVAEFAAVGKKAIGVKAHDRAILAYTEAIAWARKPGGSNRALRDALFTRGKLFDRKGDIDARNTDFEEAHQLGANIAEFLTSKGWKLAEEETESDNADYDRAIAVLSESVDWARKPGANESTLRNALFTRGKLFDRKGDIAARNTDFEEAHQLGADIAKFLTTKGWKLVEEKTETNNIEYDRAIAVLSESVDWARKLGANESTLRNALFTRGKLFDRKGDEALRDTDFAEAHQLGLKAESLVHYFKSQGKLAVDDGNPEKAIASMTEAISWARMPDGTVTILLDALFSRGKVYGRTGDTVARNDDFREAQKLGADIVGYFYSKISEAAENKAYDKAVAANTELIEWVKKSGGKESVLVKAIAARGMLYTLIGDAKKRHQDFVAAHELGLDIGQIVAFFRDAAEEAIETEEHQKAVDALTAAVSWSRKLGGEQSSLRDALFARGKLFDRTDDKTKRDKDFAEAQSLGADVVEYYVSNAILALEADEHDIVLDAIDSSIALNVTGKSQHVEMLAALQLEFAAKSLQVFWAKKEPAGTLLPALKHIGSAISHFFSDKDLDADSRSIMLDTRGQILLALERFDLAFIDFQKSIELGAATAGTFYGRGRVHERRGVTSAAIADYRKALKPNSEGVNEYVKPLLQDAKKRLEALESATDGDVAPHNESSN